MWTTENEPQPKVQSTARHGPIYLTISHTTYNGTPCLWQCCQIVLGEHTTASVETCQKTWPREAIRLARQALDEFEATLEN